MFLNGVAHLELDAKRKFGYVILKVIYDIISQNFRFFLCKEFIFFSIIFMGFCCNVFSQQEYPYNINIVIEKNSNLLLPNTHYYFLTKSNVTGQPLSSPMKIILDENLDIIYVSYPPFIASNQKEDMTFNWQAHIYDDSTTQIRYFTGYDWRSGQGNNGDWPLYDLNGFSTGTVHSIIGREETRPHAHSLINPEYNDGQIHFLILGQDWTTVGDFFDDLTFPYEPDSVNAPGVLLTENTKLEIAYLQRIDEAGNLIAEYNLTHGIELSDVDWSQFSPGNLVTLPLLHPNSVSWAYDRYGALAGEPNTLVAVIGCLSMSGGIFVNLSTGDLLYKFPKDGYKDTQGGHFPWNFNPKRGHDLRFKSNLINSETFQMSWYDNGDGNSEALEFEIKINGSNPLNKPFTFGKLWGYTFFDVVSTRLGSNRDLGNGVQLINLGEVANENPLSPYWKIQWRNRNNFNLLYAQLKFDEYGGEAFNVNAYPKEKLQFLKEQLIETWVSNDTLYAPYGYTEYWWENGEKTTYNGIPIWSSNPVDLKVLVPFGDEYGWIGSVTLDSTDLLTSIHELQSKNISIYPTIIKPGEVITVDGLQKINTYFSWIQLDGKVMHTSLVSFGEKLQTPFIPSGIYILSFNYEGETINKTIIVQD